MEFESDRRIAEAGDDPRSMISQMEMAKYPEIIVEPTINSEVKFDPMAKLKKLGLIESFDDGISQNPDNFSTRMMSGEWIEVGSAGIIPTASNQEGQDQSEQA